MSLINPSLSLSKFCGYIYSCIKVGTAMTERIDIYLLSNMQEAINLYEILRAKILKNTHQT